MENNRNQFGKLNAESHIESNQNKCIPGMSKENLNYLVEEIRSRNPSYSPENSIDVPMQLIILLQSFISDPTILSADSEIFGKILNTLKFQFENDTHLINEAGDAPSDIENLIQYKPTELIADKCTQIFCYVCIGEARKSIEQLLNLKAILENPFMDLHLSMLDGFMFVARMLELFVNMLIGTGSENVIFQLDDQDHGDEHEETKKKHRPNLNALSEKGKIVVKVMEFHFLRLFHHKLQYRVSLLEEVSIFKLLRKYLLLLSFLANLGINKYILNS